MSGSIYTQVVHAGQSRDGQFGALSTPIYNASTFVFPDAEQGSAIHEGEQPGYFYGRMGNPTQAALEAAMCDLERGEAALAGSSGMAAVTTALLTLVDSGDHIIAPRAIYASAAGVLDTLLTRLGVEVSYVDGTKTESFVDAVRKNTKLIYLETPANPTLSIIDLEAVCAFARSRSIITIVDNTFATPFNQRPLSLGADVVVHSATKYLGGHGDLLAGVIVGSSEFLDRARWKTHKLLGGVIAPNTAWLVLRGIKTLALRMERHNDNAMAVASFLSGHPKVEAVHYPGLPAHPLHSVAMKQMRGFGGVVAFDVGTVDRGRLLVNSLNLCSLAVSLGDVASLIQHSASMTHASIPPERRQAAGITDGLLRLSVGIEDKDEIIADLDQALSRLN